MEPLNDQTTRHIFSDLKERLIRIEAHAEKTNGRLSRLEEWRNRIIGGLAVVTLLLVPVVIQYVTRMAVAFFR